MKNNNTGKKKEIRPGLAWWYFSIIILVIIVGASAIAIGVYYILALFKVVEFESVSTMGIIISIIAACGIVGALAAGIISKNFTKPVEECIAAINEMAQGNYELSLDTAKGRDQVKKLKEAINKTADELGNTEVMRSDFINAVSHEYKTPVASILGYAKILKNSPLSDEQAGYVDIIIEESHNLASMTTNVLLLNRYENTEIVTDKTSFSLDEQLRRCFAQYQNFWLDKDISISGDFSNVTFYGNEELMKHIWNNIIQNAIKFTDKGGEISCCVYRKGDSAIVRIKDNGCGMDEETQKHIFDKFYQKEGSGKTEGNGLGLSIVKRTVELCGGRIRVQSEPDCGTEFTVELPIEEPAAGGQ